ncbi:MAG: hypothetical protein ACOZNI_06360 [Myxococcota bacterium]
MITATLKIYRDAATQAGRAFGRGAYALLVLVACFPVLVVAGGVAGQLGFFGGFLYTLVEAACAGTYLAMLQDALTTRKSLDFAVVRGNLGRHTWDVIGVLFPLWLVDLGLSLAKAPWVVNVVVALAIFLFFNPAPEMIGRARAQGIELLAGAYRFMMANGPEWIVPQAAVFGLAALAAPAHAIDILLMVGPRFGFVEAGRVAMSAVGSGPVGWAVGLAAVALVHGLMLFRGALYEKLGDGGRRQRAWRERLGE